MSIQSRLKQQNDILKGQLKKANEEISNLKQKLQAKQKQIKLLQKRILDMPTDIQHQTFESYNSQSESEKYSCTQGHTAFISETPSKKFIDQNMMKQSSNFDSTIFEINRNPQLIQISN